MYADVCHQQGFIGAHFGIDQDLKTLLGGEQRDFINSIPAVTTPGIQGRGWSAHLASPSQAKH